MSCLRLSSDWRKIFLMNSASPSVYLNFAYLRNMPWILVFQMALSQ